MSYTVPSSLGLNISMSNVIAWAATLFNGVSGFIELAVGVVVAFMLIILVRIAISNQKELHFVEYPNGDIHQMDRRQYKAFTTWSWQDYDKVYKGREKVVGRIRRDNGRSHYIWY